MRVCTAHTHTHTNDGGVMVPFPSSIAVESTLSVYNFPLDGCAVKAQGLLVNIGVKLYHTEVGV